MVICHPLPTYTSQFLAYYKIIFYIQKNTSLFGDQTVRHYIQRITTYIRYTTLHKFWFLARNLVHQCHKQTVLCLTSCTNRLHSVHWRLPAVIHFQTKILSSCYVASIVLLWRDCQNKTTVQRWDYRRSYSMAHDTQCDYRGNHKHAPTVNVYPFENSIFFRPGQSWPA
jgi:hypothetical protein